MGEHVRADALLPGDSIWTPGGSAVVLAVTVERSLVRVQYRDRVGLAFVFLPRSRPVERAG